MAVPERMLYIEVILVSIRTRVLGRFIGCGCSLEVVVNGGSTVYHEKSFSFFFLLRYSVVLRFNYILSPIIIVTLK